MANNRKWTKLLRAASGLIASASLSGPLMAAPAVGAYFNGVFPAQPPGSATGWTTENAFPHLTFVDPLWITNIPGSNNLLVVGKSGTIYRFPSNAATTGAAASVIVDLSSQLQISEDQGLYRLIFHPQFGQAGSPHANDVFMCYSHRPNSDGAPDRSMWRVSKFQWVPANGTISLASESVLIQQYDPHRWHNGGAMCFDNEGFLMITCGDGGGANDELGQSQKINGGFFGGVLRIDVDNDPAKSHAIARQPLDPAGKPASFPASFSQGYGIPNSNPWMGGAVLEEFYAIGLRSPHAAHYDSVTGDLWEGDVGQFNREEINRIKKGANLQWPYKEGTLDAYRSQPSVLIGNDTAPFYSYDRSVGSCIIGGPRYRGTKWASDLAGKIIFGDNATGNISAAEIRPNGTIGVSLLNSSFGIGIYSGLSGICTDSAGEIYFLKLNGQGQNGGTVRKLVRSTTQAEPPALLSATGLFSNLATLQPSPALTPYEVASPLWSDGAEKKRWIAVPTDGNRNTAAEKIAFSETGNWSFPAGTVMVKHFEMPIDARNPSLTRRLETRVIVCTANGGKYGVTYKWNAAGTDAQLLTTGAEESYEVKEAAGITETRTWSYPSRTDCLQCHTEATGQALGLRTHQFNRAITDPATGQPQNQLTAFNSAALFQPSLAASQIQNYLRSSRLDDTTAPVEHRVRSYLDSNCSHCHQPGSTAPFFDARLQTPLRLQNLVNAVNEGQFNLGPDGRHIKPGDPTLSAVHVRAASAAPGVAMPPLGKHVVDQQAMALIQSYITGLSPEEFAVTSVPQGRYFRLTALAASGSRTAVNELAVIDGRNQILPPSAVSIASVTSEEALGGAARAIDGDITNYWISASGGSFPQQITLDLGTVRTIGGFDYTPRQGVTTGRITSYQVHCSENGTDWTLLTSGTWDTLTSTTFHYDGGIGRRPVRCEIAGPATPVTAPFEVAIAFDSAVTDFTMPDLTVKGGAVTALRGKGYYYVATVLAHQSTVSISVAQNVANAALLGNRPSNTLVIQNAGDTGPVPQFTDVPAQAAETFGMNVVFDRPVVEMTGNYYTVTNGEILNVEKKGTSTYRLIVRPNGAGDTTVKLNEGNVVGTNGLPMGGSISVTIPFRTPRLAMEAEGGLISSGFVVVQDPMASGGSYLWIPDGSRAGATSFDPLLKATFAINVPHVGQYQIRASVRADDSDSDSFYLGLDGDPAPALWLTNQGAGEHGSGLFHSGLVNADGMPRTVTLTSGNHTLELYGGEDGARIDKLELIPVFPTPAWLGDGNQSDFPLIGILEFNSDVTGLEIDDFEITNGTIQSVTGSGGSYRVAVDSPYGRAWLSLKAGSVTDNLGRTNPASGTITLNFVNTYAQWAKDYGLDTSPEAYHLDQDHDGFSQFMEYAFGLDPTSSIQTTLNPADPVPKGLPLFRYDSATNRLYVAYLRRFEGAMPLSYQVITTSDFSTYTEHYNLEDVRFSEINPAWGMITGYITPPAGTKSIFGMVRVTSE